jgi:hypothetical protein
VIIDPAVTDRKLSTTEKLTCTTSLPTGLLGVGRQEVLFKGTDCTVIGRKFVRICLEDCLRNDSHN